MQYILFNPLSKGGKSLELLEKLISKLDNKYKKISVLDIETKEFVSKLSKEDEIILLGGDGTINRFVNNLDGNIPSNNIYLFPSGSGNDFAKDIDAKENELVLINKYLLNLPKVKVNDQEYYFINGIGYGIDGYCCEVGEDLRKKNKVKINYTSIAIKGLLFNFKPVNAVVEIDGEVNHYKGVWLAPTMKGRYYGGGMMVAPNQDRLNDLTLTNVVLKGKSKITTLILFPSIFKGEHIKNKKKIVVKSGKHIKVTFDRPTALQIDGEVIKDVLTYEVDLNK